MAHEFLSDEWIEAARQIREEFAGQPTGGPHTVKMNLVLTEVPFGAGSMDARLDTSSGSLELEVGHMDSPDLTVTVDYATAKAIFVEGNPQAGMQAFMAGRIKVQGDMTKMMAMQTAQPTPEQQALAARIQEITL